MSSLPFDPDHLTDANRTLYDSLVAKRRGHQAPFDGPYAALMNHPQLCKRIEDLGFYLKFEGNLPRNVYQFVVLSVARQTEAAFEWADHVEHARVAGVLEQVIETLKTYGVMKASFPAPYHLAAQILSATRFWKNVPWASRVMELQPTVWKDSSNWSSSQDFIRCSQRSVSALTESRRIQKSRKWSLQTLRITDHARMGRDFLG